ncbi:NACHT domain- and WD repeat-containing protein 1-like [Thalassophryne amazonica]|uniref:NACHT domain- and WD repeat-containing protein 1-like n=1 Tax=Thalassophryne amazonica TaxID=390379 RepID=UPI0014722D5F|nr:NACHT domain- and WD repeat-containing protein 1-like [Thalassophryne amazonica]
METTENPAGEHSARLDMTEDQTSTAKSDNRMGYQTAADTTLQNILKGKVLSGPQIKSLKSNMIRVFICSAFTDMSSERKVLLEKAYPEVLAFCRGLGLVFEVVDLRWGLRGVPAGDHEACELFLQEIEICQRISAGPAFIALLGNRYGHRALPRLIPQKHFEVFLSKLSKNSEGINLLQRWYLLDNNAIPPTYVLQPVTTHFPHYSDLRPEKKPQRDGDNLSWRSVETQLLKLLRNAAAHAETDGDITAEQKQHFYKSVTEREIEQGVWKVDGEQSALLFIRETSRQKVREGPKRFAKYMDVAVDGLLDGEARELLSSLKSRLNATSQNILNLHAVELSKGVIDLKRREHVQYLDSVCEQFVAQMQTRITAALESAAHGCPKKNGTATVEGAVSEQATEEVKRHIALSAKLSAGIQGRQGILGKLCLAMWESTKVHHPPLVVHGASGAGKTSLLCKLAQEMHGILEARALVVIRLLSASYPRCPDIDCILLSICFQISSASGLAPPSPLITNSHQELVQFFQNLLADVSQQSNMLLIILDSLDCLSDRHHAHKLRWLPVAMPPNVHMVVSMDTSSEMLVAMRLKLDGVDSFFEVGRLSRDEGQQMVDSYLQAVQRTLTPEQSGAVLQRFEHSGCPLHLKLMLSTAKRWASFTPLTELWLGDSAQEVMSLLLEKLEEKHGKEVVGGALGYITLTREGLLEAELRDVMSLDDDVIREIYTYAFPPTPSLIRLPPLLWSRLRRDLEDHLEERWVGGAVAIVFQNRHFSKAVATRYLTSERRGRYRRNLAEYFLGRWSGKLKPVALPGLSLLVSDRKVPPQPLWFAPGLANVRKLQELPYHLLHAGLWEELRQEVIGSAEWLFCKSRVHGVSSVIQDLDLCSQYMNCTETGLVRDALVLLKPSLDFLDGDVEMLLFCTELLARLSHLATPFPSVIGRLCSHCEDWLLAHTEPILIPKCSFLQQPGGALQHTLSGLNGGVLCLDISTEAELLITGSDDGVVAVWSLADMQLTHTLLGHTSLLTASHWLLKGLSGGGSLLHGKQLFCIQEAVPVDGITSSVHLHLTERGASTPTPPLRELRDLWFVQVVVWSLDRTELLLRHSSGAGSVVLGVLDDRVVSVSGSEDGVVVPKTASSISCQIYNSKCREIMKNSKRVPAGSERTLSLFHTDRNSVDRFLVLHHHDDVLSACVSSDARLLASGAADHLVRIWSVTTGALLHTLCGSDAPVSSVVLYGGFVVSASTAAAGIHVWSLKYDTCHKPTGHIPAGSTHVAISKDCDQVFYVQQQNQTEVICWDSESGSPSDLFPLSAEVLPGRGSEQTALLCGLTTGTVLIYPLALPQETLCIPPPEDLPRVCCLAVSPLEKHMAVAYDDAVRLFEITSRDNFPTVEGPLERFPLPLLQGPLSSMALLADRRVLYGTSCGEVTLCDFSDGSSSTLDPHRSRVTCVTASSRGTHALVGSEDAVQRLWALRPVALDHTMEYKGFFFEGVLSACFSDCDQFVFTGCQDSTVKVWGVATGSLLYVQYVYSPVVRMLTDGNGFMGLSQQGFIIKEAFHCPEHVSPNYNPLKNIKAQYRVTSREKAQDCGQMMVTDLQDLAQFTPSQLAR